MHYSKIPATRADTHTHTYPQHPGVHKYKLSIKNWDLEKNLRVRKKRKKKNKNTIYKLTRNELNNNKNNKNFVA